MSSFDTINLCHLRVSSGKWRSNDLIKKINIGTYIKCLQCQAYELFLIQEATLA